MPKGERIKDPVTGEEFIVVESYSGRSLDAWLADRNKGGKYQLASAERMHRPDESTDDDTDTSTKENP